MTLPFRHKIRNAKPEGLRPSTLPLGHGDFPQYFYEWMGRKHFWPPRPGNEPRTLAWKAAVLATTLGAPPDMYWHQCSYPTVRSRRAQCDKGRTRHEPTHFHPVLFQCWASVADGGQTLLQHCGKQVRGWGCTERAGSSVRWHLRTPPKKRDLIFWSVKKPSR